MKNIVAIIPARGGSKGIPRKNIKLFYGKPLIAWSILDCLCVKDIDEVYVSTDFEKISDTALAYGAKVIQRPESISGGTASSETALLHALEEIENERGEVEAVVFLQATSPVRGTLHIEQALTHFKESRADSLLSVCQDHSFLWVKAEDGTGEPVNYDPLERPMRQQMNQFRENGSIYIFKPWVLKDLGSRLGGKIVLYEMPEECMIDIDTENDWQKAEATFERQKI